jgi:hypothetical protein
VTVYTSLPNILLYRIVKPVHLQGWQSYVTFVCVCVCVCGGGGDVNVNNTEEVQHLTRYVPHMCQCNSAVCSS